MDQLGKFVSPPPGLLNRKKYTFFQSPFLKIMSLETRSTAPSRVSLLLLRTQTKFGGIGDINQLTSQKNYVQAT